MADVTGYEATMLKESQENYENTMVLNKGKEFGEYNTGRFQRDSKHINDFLDAKKLELANIQAEREKVKTEYLGMTELQNKIKEAETYLAEIEVFHV